MVFYKTKISLFTTPLTTQLLHQVLKILTENKLNNILIDRNRGPAGQNQHNPDMDPVNWVKDLKATSKNCNLTVIVVK